MARPKRFELLTPRFVVWCSIQLSYGRLPMFNAFSGEVGTGSPKKMRQTITKPAKAGCRIAIGLAPQWQDFAAVGGVGGNSKPSFMASDCVVPGTRASIRFANLAKKMDCRV